MKNIVLIVALLTASSPVWAKDYTLTVDDKELQYLGNALQELPKRIADPLIAKLQKQVMDQDKAGHEEQLKTQTPVK